MERTIHGCPNLSFSLHDVSEVQAYEVAVCYFDSTVCGSALPLVLLEIQGYQQNILVLMGQLCPNAFWNHQQEKCCHSQ